MLYKKNNGNLQRHHETADLCIANSPVIYGMRKVAQPQYMSGYFSNTYVWLIMSKYSCAWLAPYYLCYELISKLEIFSILFIHSWKPEDGNNILNKAACYQKQSLRQTVCSQGRSSYLSQKTSRQLHTVFIADNSHLYVTKPLPQRITGTCECGCDMESLYLYNWLFCHDLTWRPSTGF